MPVPCSLARLPVRQVADPEGLGRHGARRFAGGLPVIAAGAAHVPPTAATLNLIAGGLDHSCRSDLDWHWHVANSPAEFGLPVGCVKQGQVPVTRLGCQCQITRRPGTLPVTVTVTGRSVPVRLRLVGRVTCSLARSRLSGSPSRGGTDRRAPGFAAPWH
jgi:hypothetical protein